MTSAHGKLAASLERLRQLQAGGRHVFRGDEIPRYHRDRLRKNGFLRPIIRGWWMSWSPDSAPGETTPWMISFWEFCARYCEERFGEAWHLSPEHSLLLHAERTSVPRQLVIHSPQGTNNAVDLLFDTSIYDLRTDSMPPPEDVTEREGLRLLTPGAALIRVPGAFFQRFPAETRIALASMSDAAEVLERLLAGGHSVVARRLAGGFRRVGRPEIAEEIVEGMEAAGHEMREVDPFGPGAGFAEIATDVSPIVARLQALWEGMRPVVLEVLPSPPGLPEDPGTYLRLVDELYQRDAYHSLSIEGFRVTMSLIQRVRSGEGGPEDQDADQRARDALAARGYWQAFQAVRESLRDVLEGANPGATVRRAHREWCRELFQPFVAAGALSPQALAGYRRDAVYLRNSRHVPPRGRVVGEAMPAFFDLLENEEEPAVQAVLGHWMLGHIHPYPDGNGRLARFLMNVMLASGGYPWTVVPVEDRDAYMAALEAASVDGEIRPFAEFIATVGKRHFTDLDRQRPGSHGQGPNPTPL